MKNDKNIEKYSKDELIKTVSDSSGVNVSMVEIVMNSLNDVIIDKLKSADSEKDVSIRIFEGFYIDSVYIPQKTKKNNLTGRLIDVSSRLKIKPKITRGYAEKINQQI
mgnify:CR=1